MASYEPGETGSPPAQVIVVRASRSGSNRFPTTPAPKLAAAPKPADDMFNVITPLRSSTTPAQKSPMVVLESEGSRRGSAPASALLSPKISRPSPLAQSSSAVDDIAEPADQISSLDLSPPDLPPPLSPHRKVDSPKAEADPPPVATISISAFLPPPISPGKLAVAKIPVNRPASPVSPPSASVGTMTKSSLTQANARLSILRTQSIGGPSFSPPVLNSKGDVVPQFPLTGSQSARSANDNGRSSSMSAEALDGRDRPGSTRLGLALGPSLSSRELGQSLSSLPSMQSLSSARETYSPIDALVSPKKGGSALFGSAPLASLLPTPPAAPEKAPTSQRSFVITELLQTERDYIGDLELVHIVFYKPLLDRKILSPKDVLSLFSNIEQIKDVNKTLLSTIEKCIVEQPNLDEVQLGDTLVRLADFLKVYASYLQNQRAASDTLERCERTVPAFAAFLKECMAEPICRGLSFLSFIIKPTQRISKYPLLLKELLKNTPEEHTDYKSLEKAMKRIIEIVNFLNERTRESENQHQIMEIQSKLKADKPEEGTVVLPGRSLIADGTFVLLEKKESRRLYLFNDLLLAVKVDGSAKNEKLLVRNWWPLDAIKVVNVGDSPSQKNVFAIERGTDVQSFGCTDLDDKSKWLKLIRDLIKGFQKKALKNQV